MKPIMMRQVVAVIDDRTTMVCLRAAGQTAFVGEPFEVLTGDLMDPPFHWGCRSVTAPWVPGMISDQKRLANAEIMKRPYEERRFGPDGYEGKIPGVPKPPPPVDDGAAQALVDALGDDFGWLVEVPRDRMDEVHALYGRMLSGSADERAEAAAGLLRIRDDLVPSGVRSGMEAYDALGPALEDAAQVAAAGAYKSGAYRRINETLRAGGTLSSQDREVVDRLLAAMGPARVDVEVMRGMYEADALMSALRAGDVLTDAGLVSTTTDAATALHFARTRGTPAMLHITVPKGSPVAKLPLSNQEYEVLLPAGTRMRVDSVVKEAEVVDQEAWEALLERAERRGWDDDEVRRRALDREVMVEMWSVRMTVIPGG